MTKRICLAILICVATLSANAQYMHYDPIPYVPEPQAVPIPQPNYPTPVYPPPTASSAEKLVSAYLIEGATANDHDVTQTYLDANAKIAIYMKNGNLNMAVLFVKTNTQSYGVISDLQTKAVPATETTYKGIERTFVWHYKNTYNEDTGAANVSLVEIEKPDGMYFVCQVKSTYVTSVYQGHQLR